MKSEIETKKNAGSAKSRHKQSITGIVVSDKMDKSRTISVKRMVKHKLYHKAITKSSKLMIHDEKNESKIGDLVIAVSTRPLSKHKHFQLQKVVERAADR